MRGTSVDTPPLFRLELIPVVLVGDFVVELNFGGLDLCTQQTWAAISRSLLQCRIAFADFVSQYLSNKHPATEIGDSVIDIVGQDRVGREMGADFPF